MNARTIDDDPVVTIVVTNFNYSRFIEKCIRSCQEQATTKPYEVLVIDDGSTDSSLEIVRPFVNAGVRLIELSNGGVEAASNVGFSNARADLVVRVDADDYLMPEYVETIVSQIEASDHGFAYPDYLVVGPTEQLLYEEKLPAFDEAEIQERGDFLPTGTLYRKAVIQELGGYDESTPNCGLENYELVLKLLRAGHTGLHVPRPLFAYRRHGLNMSTRKEQEIVHYGRRLFERLGLGPYRTNAFHPFRLVVGDE